jgi:hypothetical protein
MFTIEIDWDETAITILDPEGKKEDLQVYMYDDVVYIRQWMEEIERFLVIEASPHQFYSLMNAMKLPEGAYTMEGK